MTSFVPKVIGRITLSFSSRPPCRNCSVKKAIRALTSSSAPHLQAVFLEIWQSFAVFAPLNPSDRKRAYFSRPGRKSAVEPGISESQTARVALARSSTVRSPVISAIRSGTTPVLQEYISQAHQGRYTSTLRLAFTSYFPQGHDDVVCAEGDRPDNSFFFIASTLQELLRQEGNSRFNLILSPPSAGRVLGDMAELCRFRSLKSFRSQTGILLASGTQKRSRAWYL